MSSHDTTWRHLQAGEYVLGTLEDSDIAAFNSLLNENVELEQMVIQWQEEFQPIADNVGLVEPPDFVWQQLAFSITRELQHYRSFERNPFRRKRSDKSQPQLIHSAASSGSGRERTGWQIFGSLATAASVILGILLVYEYRKPDAPYYESIAIVTGEDKSPLWIVDVSPGSDELRIVAVAVPDIDRDRDHQLWMVKSDNSGVVSLGLLPKQANTSRFIKVDGIKWDAQTVAVSLEPAGGSMGQGPSGPVLFQGSVRLLQAVSP